MAPDDHSGVRPAGPVVLRIKLRYDDVEAMVQRFASNVGKSGLFLPTRSIQPVGTEVKFELRLANDTPVLVGMGRVRFAQKPDPANPRAVFGMAIELTRVSRDGRSIIIRMIERRRALGLPDVSIPLPEDIEAARRGEVETQPRGDTSAVVRDAMTQLASTSSAAPLTGEPPASGPIGVAKPGPASVPPAEPTPEPPPGTAPGPTSEPPPEASRSSAPLLTSPRPAIAAVAVQAEEPSARIPVPVLAPEKSRPRRPRVQEIIDRAAELSAPIIAAMPAIELDMHVDVDRVLARARSLAGGELDDELDKLRDAAAAPIEISVEAASAELARQLGGKAVVRRERSGSARWAPPPAVEIRTPVPAANETAEDAPRAAEASAPEPAPEPVASSELSTKLRAPTVAAPSAAIAEVVEAAVASRPDTAASSASDASSASTSEAAAPASPDTSVGSTPAPAEATADDDAETPVLAGDDYVQAFVPNPTTITGVEEVLSPAERAERPDSEPDVQTQPTHRQLMIDDDADVASFERALDSRGAGHRADTPPLAEEPASVLASGEYQLVDDDAGERTVIGSLDGSYPASPEQLAARLDRELADAERELERELAEDGIGRDDDAPVEEVSELDVLAEADEADADLLVARGEAEVSGAAAPMQPAIDTGYDDAITPPPVDVAYPHHAAPEPHAYAPAPEPHAYAPPARDSVDDFAARLDLGDDDEPLPSEAFDREAAREFDAGLRLERADDGYASAAADESASRKLRGPDPRLLRYGRATTVTTDDLEDTLAALDVDFDALSADQQRSPRASSRAREPRPLPGLPLERPPTGQQPVVTKSPTGRQAVVARSVATPASARASAKRVTKPPPIPAAARKPPTRQVPVVPPPKRVPTEDDGVLIDFDDDE